MAGSEIGGQIKTRVDELIALIDERRQISAPDAAKALSVEQDMIESWARFLEKSGDIMIVYKGLTPTFVAVENESPQTPQPPKQSSDRAGVWRTISEAIQRHLDKVTSAVEKKAYESIKPALVAMREQIEHMRERLEAASIEAKDRRALEQSIERVTKRIERVETHSSGSKASKLKSESKRLEADVVSLAKQLENLPEPAQVVPSAPKPSTHPAAAPSGSELKARVDVLEHEARAALEAGDIEHASELQSQIEALYDEQLPHEYEQLRSAVKERLYALKQDLTFASDAHVARSFSDHLTRLVALLERYGQAVESRAWDEAESIEHQIVAEYDTLPQGHEDEKKRFEQKLGERIMAAAQTRRSELEQRVTKIKDVLAEGKHALNAAIERGDFTTARSAYADLRALINHVPPELVIERIDLQRDLLGEFERLTGAFKERFIAQNEARIERCTHLIETVKHALADPDFERAESAYAEASEALAGIDHNYFEQRSRLQYDLMKVHKSILDAKAARREDAFDEIVSRFQETLKDGRTYVVKGERALAEAIYLKLLEIYRELPHGNDERKQALKTQISDFYRDLNEIHDAGEEVDLDDILERLVSMHHEINAGDPSVLSSELKRIEQLVEALPESLTNRNPALKRELVRLTHLRHIYEHALDANSQLDEGEVPDDLARFIDESEAWIEHERMNAASIVLMLRALRRRLDEVADDAGPADPTIEGPPALHHLIKEPAEPPELSGPSNDENDLSSRIEAIRSLLKD